MVSPKDMLSADTVIVMVNGISATIIANPKNINGVGKHYLLYPYCRERFDNDLRRTDKETTDFDVVRILNKCGEIIWEREEKP